MKAWHSLSLSVLVLSCVLSLQAAGAAANSTWPTRPAADANPPATAAVCRLHLEGFGNRPGFKKAQLSCTGGSVSAAADPQLLKALGPDTTRGVVWSQNPACQGSLGTCVLVLCGGTAIIPSPTIRGLKWDLQQSRTQGESSALCITGGTWWLTHGTFAHNHAIRPIDVRNLGTRVHIKQCSFVGNMLQELKGTVTNGAAVTVGALAKAAVQSSSFVDNRAQDGGAIEVNNAELIIYSQGPPSVFHNNHADYGGHISANERSRVGVFDTQLEGSSARLAGGAFYAVKSNVSVVNTTISNSRVTGEGDGGGIFLGDMANVQVVDSMIQHCAASCPLCDGGAVGLTDAASLVMSNSHLVNSSAGLLGGGLNARGTAKVTLQGVTFTNNRAQYGGGLALGGKASLTVNGVSQVQHGSAKVCGGGVLLRSSNFTTSEVLGGSAALLQATDNSATYDADVCLGAKNITLVSNSSLDNFVANSNNQDGLLHVTFNVSGPQGLPSNTHIALSVVNNRNTTVATDVLRGDTSEGLRHVAVKLKQPPGAYNLSFRVMDDREVPPATMQLRIVGCPVGYVTASSGDACSFCVRGYFSFNPTDKECRMCVPHAECPGGDVLQPAQGFWHSAPRSTQMHRCINPAACLGRVALAANSLAVNTSSTSDADGYKTAQCAPTYEGNLCAGCRPGYGKSRPFQCRKCMGRAAIVVLYLGAALAVVGLIKLLTFLRTSSQSVERKSLQEPLPEELVKVLVLHGQWLFILSNLVGVPWPSTLMAPLQVISGLWSSSSGSSIGLECILPRDTAVPAAVQMVLLRLFTPVTILCVVLVGQAVPHRIWPARYPGARHQLATLVITVVFLFLPTWLSTAFSLFTCIRLDQPASWPYQARAVGLFWVEDVGEQCWVAGGYHRAWAIGLGVPLLLMLCVLLPAGLFVFLWHSRKRGLLSDPVFVQHYGFMYQMWREKVCWYESVVALQTIGLSLVSTFGFALDSHHQVLVTMAVLGVVVVLLLWLRPFKCPAANGVAVQSACALLLTAYAALTFLPFNNREPSPVYGNIMGVMLLLLNLGFLVLTGWKLARAVDWSVPKEWLRSKMGAAWGVKAPEQGCGKDPAPGAQGVVASKC